MAYSRGLDKSKLQTVRRQLSHVIGHFHRDVVDAENTEIHETFELCMIQGDDFALMKDENLSSIVKRTGLWQHLIKTKGKPIGIAHSGAHGPLENTWSVQNFFVTPISVKIARAVARIDRARAKDDIEVILVTVPSKLVDFFLLRSSNKTEVYLIVGRDTPTGLIEGRFYTGKRFLKLLLSAPNAAGLGGIGRVSDLPSPQANEK
jgi:hypothetical protein